VIFEVKISSTLTTASLLSALGVDAALSTAPVYLLGNTYTMDDANNEGNRPPINLKALKEDFASKWQPTPNRTLRCTPCLHMQGR